MTVKVGRTTSSAPRRFRASTRIPLCARSFTTVRSSSSTAVTANILRRQPSGKARMGSAGLRFQERILRRSSAEACSPASLVSITEPMMSLPTGVTPPMESTGPRQHPGQTLRRQKITPFKLGLGALLRPIQISRRRYPPTSSTPTRNSPPRAAGFLLGVKDITPVLMSL